MNVERCWCGHGFCAAALAFLVFVASVGWTPARTDAPGLLFAGSSPSAPILFMHDALPARAILPAGSAVPAPVFERSLSEEPPGTLYAGVIATAGVEVLRLLPGRPLGFTGAGDPFPRHVFLHVYRC